MRGVHLKGKLRYAEELSWSGSNYIAGCYIVIDTLGSIIPYSGFILRGFKSCELPASQHLISSENYVCKFLELVVYLR